MSQTTLVTIYYPLFHSVMNYGIIFWGGFYTSQNSCRNWFKQYYHFKLRYILSVHLFVTGNKDNFITNLEQYSVYTRQNKDLYLPQSNLAIYQKGVCYAGVKIFSDLTSDIKTASDNTKRFKNLLICLLIPFTV